MSRVVCHAHPQAEAFFASLLRDTGFQVVSRALGEAGEEAIEAHLITAYQPAAPEHRLHAGIQQLVRWRRNGNRAPALVCSFRSKHSLLLLPENSILREPGTSFLRFPCDPTDLLSALECPSSLPARELENVLHRACTVWGQLSSSIERLINVVEEDRERALDFEPLRDFAGRHFGNPIFSTLSRAERRWQESDRTETIRLLRNAQEKAPEAAVYRVFSKLAHGREADLSNKGVGPLRAALVSVQQDLAGEEHLETRLATENWSDFKSALQDATRTLTLLQEGPYSLPDDLQGQVHTFLEQVERLLRMTETGTIQERPAAGVKVIDKLQDNSRSILRRGPDDAE